MNTGPRQAIYDELRRDIVADFDAFYEPRDFFKPSYDAEKVFILIDKVNSDFVHHDISNWYDFFEQKFHEKKYGCLLNRYGWDYHMDDRLQEFIASSYADYDATYPEMKVLKKYGYSDGKAKVLEENNCVIFDKEYLDRMTEATLDFLIYTNDD